MQGTSAFLAILNTKRQQTKLLRKVNKNIYILSRSHSNKEATEDIIKSIGTQGKGPP